MIDATDKFVAEQYLSNGGLLNQFMPNWQRFALKNCIASEEGEFFVQKVLEIAKVIRDMPKTYETESIDSGDKIAHLHYFRGGVDAWVVEKDKGEESPDTRQHQAYGKITLFGGGVDEAEWGYISIQELIDNGVELDLHWTPKAMREVK